MSAPTIPAGSFDDFEFEALVADFDQPTPPIRRPSRTVARREAIDRGLGINRHRTSEREV